MANADTERRLRDEFFLASEARPATAEHYMAWFESYIDKGNGWNAGQLTLEPFPAEKFFTVSRNARLPDLGQSGVSLIVPPGVKLTWYNNIRCNVYSFDTGDRAGEETIRVWKEMLDGLINDGYKLSKLIQSSDITTAAQVVIIAALRGEPGPDGTDFYRELSKNATFEGVKAMAERLKGIDAVDLVRKYLDIRPETPIDDEAKQSIDGQMKAAAQVLDVLRFKMDPDSRKPIPDFGKRAKIQVGPVIRLKDQPGKP